MVSFINSNGLHSSLLRSIDSFQMKKGTGLLSLQFSLRIRKRSLQGCGQREKKIYLELSRRGKKTVVVAVKRQTDSTN